MTAEPANPLLQDLRGFTVRIVHGVTGAIVGTGIAVSVDGQVATCAHVVEQAGASRRGGDGVEVGVLFPQVPDPSGRTRRARVRAWFPRFDDDIVVLQLVGPMPLPAEKLAILGTAAESDGHQFRSYGYRRLDKYIAGRADGRILGCVECPDGVTVQADPVQLESSQINAGMSGAAVLDVERNLVVGIVSETWFPDQTSKDRDTAWAIDGRVLSLDPLNIPVRHDPLPRRPAPEPQIPAAPVARPPLPRVDLHDAPPPAGQPSLPEIMRSLDSDWVGGRRRVTELRDTSIASLRLTTRVWVDRLVAGSGDGGPAGVFWWNFAEQPDAGAFLETALRWMNGGDDGEVQRYSSPEARAHLLAAHLADRRYLFILDGLDAVQHRSGDEFGEPTSAALQAFLLFFARPTHASLCVTISRIPVFSLMAFTTCGIRDLEQLPGGGGNTPDDPRRPARRDARRQRRPAWALAGALIAVIAVIAVILLWPPPKSPPTPTQTPPHLAVNREVIEFNEQAVDIPRSEQLTLTNAGDGTVTILDTRIEPKEVGFSLRASTCIGAGVSATQPCVIDITFQPRTEDEHNAKLMITDDAPGSTATVALHGRGVRPATPTGTQRATPSPSPTPTTQPTATRILTPTATPTPTPTRVTVTPLVQVAVEKVEVTPSTVTVGEATTGKIMLTDRAPSGGVAVSLSPNVSDNRLITIPPSVNVPEGKRSQTFKIETHDIGSEVFPNNGITTGAVVAPGSVRVTITAELPTGDAKSANFVITPKRSPTPSRRS